MNSKERCRTAMSGKVPDRVPVIPQLCHPHAIKTLGKDFRENIIRCLENPCLVNEFDLLCARMYGFDGLRIWANADPIRMVDDGENVWQIDEKTGKKIGRVDFQGGGGIVQLEEKKMVEDEEDIKKIPVKSYDELLKTENFKAMKRIVDDAGKDLFVIGPPGPFTVEYVAAARGKEQMMVDIMERPDYVKKIIERATDVAIQTGIALAKIGMDALYLGEVFGGLIGPRLFKEFCVPAIKRFVKEVKKESLILTYLHICGNSTQLFEMMADTGVDCIEPLDPLGGVVVADAKNRIGKQVALMGGVNTIKLAHGTLEEVKKDIQRCLREGAPEGGYILACGDMLPTETSKEKVETMVSAAKEYRY